MFNHTLDFIGKTHMFLQKSKKFHSVLSFETNGLTLNNRFSFVLSKLTSKFGKEWIKYGIFRDFKC